MKKLAAELNCSARHLKKFCEVSTMDTRFDVVKIFAQRLKQAH